MFYCSLKINLKILKGHEQGKSETPPALMKIKSEIIKSITIKSKY